MAIQSIQSHSRSCSGKARWD